MISKYKRTLLMIVNVMGTDYKVFASEPEYDDGLKRCDGYIAPEKKMIVLDRNNKDIHQQHVLTHELVHAFLYESGLDVETWANNEEIVDWIALQLFKMNDTVDLAFKKLKPFYCHPKVEIEKK